MATPIVDADVEDALEQVWVEAHREFGPDESVWTLGQRREYDLRLAAASRTRVAAVLLSAADYFASTPWDEHLNPLLTAIDHAAGYVPGNRGAAEDTSIAAWDALAVHLGDQWPGDWEREVGRTQADVENALRAAAAKAVTP
jgi:hypothetical protein